MRIDVLCTWKYLLHFIFHCQLVHIKLGKFFFLMFLNRNKTMFRRLKTGQK